MLKQQNNTVCCYLSNFYTRLPKFPFGDYPMWLYFSSKMKIHHLKEETAVYRVLKNSASHTEDIEKALYFRDKVYGCKIFMIENCFQEKYYLKEQIRNDYVSKVLHCCIMYNSYNNFLERLDLIKEVRGKILRIVFDLCYLNFTVFSFFYRFFYKILR